MFSESVKDYIKNKKLDWCYSLLQSCHSDLIKSCFSNEEMMLFILFENEYEFNNQKSFLDEQNIIKYDVKQDVMNDDEESEKEEEIIISDNVHFKKQIQKEETQLLQIAFGSDKKSNNIATKIVRKINPLPHSIKQDFLQPFIIAQNGTSNNHFLLEALKKAKTENEKVFCRMYASGICILETKPKPISILLTPFTTCEPLTENNTFSFFIENAFEILKDGDDLNAINILFQGSGLAQGYQWVSSIQTLINKTKTRHETYKKLFQEWDT